MRVLLDECLPRQLARDLGEHRVETATREGWSGLKNGELLAAAAGAYDVVITIDQGFAANVAVPPTLAVITLAAPGNRIESLRALVPALRDALATILPGQRLRLGV